LSLEISDLAGSYANDSLRCDDCGARRDLAHAHHHEPAPVAPVFEYSVTDERGGILRLASLSYATAHAEGFGGTVRHGDLVLGAWPVPERIRRAERKAHEAAAKIASTRELRRRAA